jgi:hypothetical protein
MVVGLRLLRLAGSGGEGEVWEARNERGQQRALKLIRPDALADDADDRGRHLLAIDHPALVRVYRGGRLRGGSLDGWGFLEMDYIDGPSLQDAPPDPAVLERLEPLAEALDLLHAGAWTDGLPLVHRDVKPANLVEDADGRLVLVDPSTLRGIDGSQLTRVGTPVFSAPEVMTGRFGPPADVYSFAVTIVALLTGARGEELAAVLDEAHTLDLPDSVALALSPVPGDRPISCRAVLEGGEELADDPTMLLPALERAHASGEWAAPVHATTWQPDPWEAAPAPGQGDEPVLRRRRRRWPGTWLFVALLAVPTAAAWSGQLPPSIVVPALLGMVAVHLVAHVVGRTSLALAVLVPPVAWGVLLGRRVLGGSRRRAWGSAVFTAATAPATVGVAHAALRGLSEHRTTAYAGVAATVVLVLLSARAANTRGAGAVVIRLLLIPLWAAGAVVIVVGSALLAPFGVARGMAWSTLASLGDGIRGPAMMPTGRQLER